MNLREQGDEAETECAAATDVAATFQELAETGIWRGAGSRRRAGPRRSPPSIPAKDALATRAAGAEVMSAFKKHVPTMLGGAADLVESTKTVFEGAGTYSRNFAGRNIPSESASTAWVRS